MGNSFPMSTTGRVVRIPEQVTTRSGTPMAKFTIAVQDFARQPDGSWVPRQSVNHDVVAFGATAHAVTALRLEAGDPVIVVGDLVFSIYETRDRVARASCEIRARVVALDASADGITISRTAARSVQHAAASAGPVSAPAGDSVPAQPGPGQPHTSAPPPPPPPSIPDVGPAAHQPAPAWPDPPVGSAGLGR